MKFRFSVGHFDASFWWVFVVVCWFFNTWLAGSAREMGWGDFLRFLQLPCSGQLECDSAKKKHCFKLPFFSFFRVYHLNHRPTTLLLFNTEPENRSRELYRRNTDDWWGRLYNLLQSTDLNPNCFPPIKLNYFKTTLKKAQRVIKTWQMTLIVNNTLKLSL